MFRPASNLPKVWSAVVLGLALPAAAQQAPQNDTDDASAKSATYEDVVRADQPAAYWRFEDAEGNAELNGSPWRPQSISGSMAFSRPGPRGEKFPLFAAENQAVVFTKPASLRYDDPGANSPLDFAAGESITIEAWVNPTKINSGQQIYIIGKGRTGNKGFASDNHNWSLRLLGKDGGCRFSFLFRDADNRKGVQDDWHRWVSDAGFAPGSGWHYLAVSYQFGKGDS